MKLAIMQKRSDLNSNIHEPVLLISGTHCVIRNIIYSDHGLYASEQVHICCMIIMTVVRR